MVCLSKAVPALVVVPSHLLEHDKVVLCCRALVDLLLVPVGRESSESLHSLPQGPVQTPSSHEERPKGLFLGAFTTNPQILEGTALEQSPGWSFSVSPSMSLITMDKAAPLGGGWEEASRKAAGPH